METGLSKTKVWLQLHEEKVSSGMDRACNTFLKSILQVKHCIFYAPYTSKMVYLCNYCCRFRLCVKTYWTKDRWHTVWHCSVGFSNFFNQDDFWRKISVLLFFTSITGFYVPKETRSCLSEPKIPSQGIGGEEFLLKSILYLFLTFYRLRRCVKAHKFFPLKPQTA